MVIKCNRILYNNNNNDLDFLKYFFQYDSCHGSDWKRSQIKVGIGQNPLKL